MNSAELLVMDVGHGNAAVYREKSVLVVIDGGPDHTLAEYLEQGLAQKIDAIMISHADADHLRGILYLLEANPSVVVDSIYVNPAQERDTDLWRSFSVEVRRLERQGTKIITALTRSSPGELRIGQATFEVLSPPPSNILVERRDNRWSAIVRLVFHGTPVALFTGDADAVALQEVCDYASTIHARILVFPHHGGYPGGRDPVTFSRELLHAVRPDVVLFSIGRGRYDNPLPAVLSSALERDSVRIACTQLSRRCSEQTFPDRGVNEFSAGHYGGLSCAGTIRFQLPLPDQLTLRDHQRFVDVLVHAGESPQCRLTKN